MTPNPPRQRPLLRRLALRVGAAPLAWALLFTVLGAGVAGWRAVPQLSDSLALTDLGVASAGQSAEFLPGAVVWRPGAAESGLVYQPFDGSGASPILTYPDVRPQEWHAAPAGFGTYHIVWLEQSGQLRNAVISQGGDTLRGPIPLAARAARGVVCVPIRDGGLFVAWAHPATQRLTTIVLDDAGRPSTTLRPSDAPVGGFAAAFDAENKLHAAWLTSASPNVWTLYYAGALTSGIAFGEAQTLGAFTLTLDETLGALGLALDSTHAYILWSVVSAARPDAASVAWLSVALADASQGMAPASQAPPQRALDWESDPMETVPFDIIVGPTDKLSVAFVHGPQSQQTTLALAAKRRGDAGWQPALVRFRDGRAIAYEILGQPVAGIESPVVSATASGSLVGAWLELEGARPHLYLAAAQSATSKAPSRGELLRLARDGLLAAGPLALVWVLIPTAALLTQLRPRWPIVLGTYTLAKLLWPYGLLTHVSPVIEAVGGNPRAPGAAVAAVLVITGLAATCAMAAVWRGRRHAGWAWLAFAGLDVGLTAAVFGANLTT